MDTYFKIDTTSIKAGISHQAESNLMSIIKYCVCKKYKLIKPIFILDGKHNNGKDIKTNFSEYYDIDNITVNSEKFKMYEEKDIPANSNIIFVEKKSYKNGLIRNSNEIGKYTKGAFDIKMDYTFYLHSIAKNISALQI